MVDSSRSLRVLHVIASLSPRLGGPSALLPLARAQAREGAEVTVYTTDLDERGRWLPWERPRRRSGPAVERETHLTVHYFRAQWPSRWSFSIPLARALARDVGGFDIVHVHSLYLFHGAMTARACRRAGVPYVVRPHGTLDPYHHRQHRWRKLLYERLIEYPNLRSASAIHCTSEQEREFVRAVGLGAPLFVCPLGTDPPSTLPERGRFRRSAGIAEDARLVVFLGRITKKKGVAELVRAFRAVSDDFPDSHLVVAGPDDDGLAASIRSLVDERLAPRITWTGLLVGTGKWELLRDADVFALPSLDENFGLAAAEALSMGVPLVVTEHVGIHADISRTGAGVIVDPEPASIARGLRKVLSDDVLRRRMSSSARALAETSFSASAAARSLDVEYRRILGRS